MANMQADTVFSPGATSLSARHHAHHCNCFEHEDRWKTCLEQHPTALKLENTGFAIRSDLDIKSRILPACTAAHDFSCVKPTTLSEKHISSQMW